MRVRLFALSSSFPNRQIRFPVLATEANTSKAPPRWSHGLICEGGRYLYVASGIGTSGVPLRWGIPPE
jgi:hypothetical protein